VALLYFFHICQKNSVFYSEICFYENINNTAEETTLSVWLLCESYEYSVSCDDPAAHIESLGEMGLVHCLTSFAFIQLYINELADMLHVFNIEYINLCQGLGNIKDRICFHC